MFTSYLGEQNLEIHKYLLCRCLVFFVMCLSFGFVIYYLICHFLSFECQFSVMFPSLSRAANSGLKKRESTTTKMTKNDKTGGKVRFATYIFNFCRKCRAPKKGEMTKHDRTMTFPNDKKTKQTIRSNDKNNGNQ